VSSRLREKLLKLLYFSKLLAFGVVIFWGQTHHLTPGIDIFLRHVAPVGHRILIGDSGDGLAELVLLLLEETHAFADIFGKAAVGAGVIIAYEALQIVIGKQWVGFRFLLEDYLQQDTARDFGFAFLVDNNERNFLKHQLAYLLQRDVLAFFSVVQSSVRILLDYSGLFLFAHG
jgi:hypothetical protein